MIIKKLTEGCVEQIYDTEKGCFISQRFIADNLCEYEDDEDPSEVNRDETTNYMADKYLPFDMVQPVQEIVESKLFCCDICQNS